MLDPDTTRHSDLRDGRGPWRDMRPLLAWLPTGGRRCEVLVVGAGITGALVAEHLASQGRDVVVLDRETATLGSTAASTALLQWELDRRLTDLAGLYGQARAARIYQRSFRAVQGLADLAGSLEGGPELRRRPTLYLAAGDVGPADLERELAGRITAELPGRYLDRATLMAAFGIDREAALLSPGSAEIDPLALAQALLLRAAQLGAGFVRGEAKSYIDQGTSSVVELADGSEIEARHVVLATGYVMPDFAASDLHSVASTFALATVPQSGDRLWPERALIWEASEDYLYARTTAENRIIIGGGDEQVEDPEAREAMASRKTESLKRQLAALWPQAEVDVELAWSGAFGRTVDALPLIGPVAARPGLYAAYGYGGNGITFSFMASRMIAAMIAGEDRPWFADFALDRVNPLG
jgi:glycine/D-amino acid oxidase-like deaminating enzyme